MAPSDTSHTHVLTGSLVPTGGTTGQVLTKKTNADGDTDWEAGGGGGGGSGPVLVATTTMTSADILAWNTTPFEVVPAAGAGTILVPVYGAIYYEFGTVPYSVTGGGNGNIYCGTDADLNNTGSNAIYVNASGPTVGAQGFDGVTVDSMMRLVNGPPTAYSVGPVSDMENLPLMLEMYGKVFADGDGTFTVTVWYTVINV